MRVQLEINRIYRQVTLLLQDKNFTEAQIALHNRGLAIAVEAKNVAKTGEYTSKKADAEKHLRETVSELIRLREKLKDLKTEFERTAGGTRRRRRHRNKTRRGGRK